MKLLAWVVLAFGAFGAAVAGGCGGQAGGEREGTAIDRLTAAEAVYLPSSQGGVLLYAGTGTRGCLDGDLSTATFNDPAAVLPLNDANQAIAVADWGCNALRFALPTVVSTMFQAPANLLTNSRAELGLAGPDIVGWTPSLNGGNWTTTSSACADCGEPADGSRFFYAGNSATDASLYQEVDLGSNFAGSTFCFSGLARSYNEVNPDSTQVDVQSLDANRVAIPGYSASTGPKLFTGNWSPVELQWRVPAGARKVRVILRSKRNGCSTCSNDGYFDALQLRQGICQGWFPDRPQALARTPGGILVGGKGLCYWDYNSFFSCADQYQNTYIQALAVSGSRAYLASSTQGVGYVSLDATGAPSGPIVKLTSRSTTLVGFANALAVQKVDVQGSPPLDYLFVASGWQPDPVQNASLGHRIHRYQCSTTTADCGNDEASGATPGFVDGAGKTVLFRRPSGLGMGRFGDYFIADTGNHAVRRGYKTSFAATIGGNGTPGNSGNGGLSVKALFNEPSGVGIANNGDIYVADRGNNQIRKIVCASNDICASADRFDPASVRCIASPGNARDDSNICTRDECDVFAVRHLAVSDGTPCSDSNVCNGAESCNQGTCQSGTPLTAQQRDDSNPCTVDSCDPVQGVRHQALPVGAACSSGDVCRLPGTCDASTACVAGAPTPTDDGNDCTTDGCGTSGVTHTFNAAGTSCNGSTGKCDATGGCVPNNVGSLNQGAIDRTLPTPPNKLFDDFLASNGGGQAGTTACVYDSSNTSCAFIPSHMALVRGLVADANGAGLAGVTISVVNHPEFGSTLSLANGEYFMVVNGGGPLSIRAAKAGLLPSDRPVNPAWGGTEVAKDIVLVPLDSTFTNVSFAASGGTVAWGANVAEAGVVTRQASVFFPQGVGVTAEGQSLSGAKFRVTELTVGANGKARMPADVADNTMYTYAAEFTLEDANGKVYGDVQFTTPVISYVTNFLGLSLGDVVPVGYYNRSAGRWEPMVSGRVIKIASISNGLATISGLQAGDPPATTDEQKKLANYSVGTMLWRLPLSHFSPLDFNLGVGAPACETQGITTVCPGVVAAQATGGDDGPACGSCQKTGSIIDVERQVLRETFPVVGTPFSLNYSSENTLGYAWNKTLGINFETHPKHSKMKSYVIDFKVAGKRVVNGGLFKDQFGNWPKSYQTTWDGRDQDGRAVQGAVTATLDVGAVYKAERRGVTTFGSAGGFTQDMPPSLTGLRADPDITIWTRHVRKLQVWDASALGFGGWSISAHHTFDPVGNVIYLGDGTHRKVDNLGSGVVSLVGGTGTAGRSPDGTPATAAAFNDIESLAVGRDGDVFVAIPGDNVVRKITVVNGLYGSVRDYAGKSGAPPATLSNATVPPVGAYLSEPVSIALHDDGRLVVADRTASRVYEISADGATLRPIAGTGDPSVCSSTASHDFVPFVDGTAAKTVGLCKLVAVATGPDGSTYFVNENWVGTRSYVGRIDPAGGLWHVAGTFGDDGIFPGAFGYGTVPPGTTGTQIALIHAGLAVDRNNTVFLSMDYDVVAVPPTGVIREYPLPLSGRTLTSSRDSIDFALFGDGAFLRPADSRNLQRCTTVGSCGIVAGSTTWQNKDTVIGAPAVGNQIPVQVNRIGVAIGPDGSIFEAHTSLNNSGARIFRITSPAVAPNSAEACVYKVPSEAGGEYYCFDANGQHRSTVNALTNGTIRRFTYYTTGASAGLLNKIIEVEGGVDAREIVVDRSTSGVVKITSPGLQQTQITLDPDKKIYATAIAGDGSIAPTHDLNNGLLTALTDADGQAHSFAYDSFGRLQKDTDPAGGYQYLTRTETATGKYTVTDATRLGKADWFSREILADGTEQRVFGRLDGLTSTTNRDLGGTNTTTFADGTVLVQTPGSDPRWGALAPLMAKSSVSIPAGSLAQSATTSRTLLADGKSFSDLVTLSGATTRTYTRVYADAAKTLELSSPLGRKITYTLDAQGRVKAVQTAGAVKIDFSINASTGRLDQVSQGVGRVVNLAYSAGGANKGFLTSVDDPHPSTNASPLTTVLVPDAKGKPLSATRVDTTTFQNLITKFDWTGSGQLKLVTPPSNAAHGLQFDTRGLFTTYVPPSLGGTDEKTTYNLDLDRYLESVDWPGSDDLVVITDPIKGRTTSLRMGALSIDYAYYGAVGDPSCPDGCASGHLRTLTDNRSGSPLVTTLKWFNALPRSIDQTLTSVGAAIASASWSYNNDLRVTGETLVAPAHTSTATLGYDNDGLLTCVSLGSCALGQTGMLTLGRDPASGRLTGLTLDTSPKETLSYNAYGELLSQVSTPFRIDYEDLAATPGHAVGGPDVTRDALGRVKRHIEKLGAAAARTYDYTYDDQNRLWKVDGAVSNEYRYDNNGNRIYARNSAGVVDGTNGNGNVVYDAQDRLIKYGATSFDYTLKGNLWHRYASEGTTTYEYDALGALRSVRLPDTRLISYVLDALGRRIGKQVNGTLVKQWVYGRGLAPLAELDGSGAVLKRFVYGSRANAPDFIKTYPDNKLYRVYSDQLGTPRVIYDVAASTIAKAIEFDEFGIKLPGDTNPAFDLVFGFAGGLYDPDTQLTRFGARDYDASVGRWVSKDPILFNGRQANLYVYSGNDPENRADASGTMAPVLAAMAGGAAAGALFGGGAYLWSTPKGCWTWKGFGGHVFGGLIAGAGAPLVAFGFAEGAGLGLFAAAVAGETGFIGDVVSQTSDDRDVDYIQAAAHGALNAVGGALEAGSILAGESDAAAGAIGTIAGATLGYGFDGVYGAIK